MNANELMIGDWVNVLGEIGKVESINAMPNTIEVGKVGYRAEFVKPIRLTEEILQKNGFKKVDAIIYDYPRVGVNYEYRVTQEGLRVLVNNSCVGAPTCTSIKTCKCVHEVQQLLRMCNISKELKI